MIIRPTLKLAKKLNEPDLPPALGPAKDPLLDWHATLFRAERNQYILLMNSLSLYSVVLHGSGILDLPEFMRQALFTMRETMACDGLIFYPSRIAPHTGGVSFCKTIGPSPLTSMNDLANRAARYLSADDRSPIEVGLLLNDIPLLSLHSHTPRETIQALAGLPIEDK